MSFAKRFIELDVPAICLKYSVLPGKLQKTIDIDDLGNPEKLCELFSSDEDDDEDDDGNDSMIGANDAERMIESIEDYDVVGEDDDEDDNGNDSMTETNDADRMIEINEDYDVVIDENHDKDDTDNDSMIATDGVEWMTEQNENNDVVDGSSSKLDSRCSIEHDHAAFIPSCVKVVPARDQKGCCYQTRMISIKTRQPGDPGCENYDVEKCRLMKVRNFGNMRCWTSITDNEIY